MVVIVPALIVAGLTLLFGPLVLAVAGPLLIVFASLARSQRLRTRVAVALLGMLLTATATLTLLDLGLGTTTFTLLNSSSLG